MKKYLNLNIIYLTVQYEKTISAAELVKYDETNNNTPKKKKMKKIKHHDKPEN